MVAGRLKAAEVTTTEAVKKDLPPLCIGHWKIWKAAEFSDDERTHNLLIKN